MAQLQVYSNTHLLGIPSYLSLYLKSCSASRCSLGHLNSKYLFIEQCIGKQELQFFVGGGGEGRGAFAKNGQTKVEKQPHLVTDYRSEGGWVFQGKLKK